MAPVVAKTFGFTLMKDRIAIYGPPSAQCACVINNVGDLADEFQAGLTLTCFCNNIQSHIWYFVINNKYNICLQLQYCTIFFGRYNQIYARFLFPVMGLCFQNKTYTSNSVKRLEYNTVL